MIGVIGCTMHMLAQCIVFCERVLAILRVAHAHSVNQ